jgi:sugar lactone lactonase YvrE
LIISEDDERTYSAKLENNGTLVSSVFAERGGTSVVTDGEGNTYIASGQVYVYNREGKQIGTLEVPERRSSLAFGGPGHRTLFSGARSSLYAIATTHAGY